MFEINTIFILIVCLCMLYQQNKRHQKYSIYSGISIFTLIFFIATPIVTRNYEIEFWQFNTTEQLYEEASFLILMFLLFYVIGYELTYKLKKIKNKTIDKVNKGEFNRKKIYILLTGVLIIQLIINDFNILAVFIRDYQESEASILRTQLPYLINLTFFKTVPVIIFLYYWININNNYKKVDRVITLVFMLIIAPPTSLPRFMAGVIYLPIIYAYFLYNNFMDYRKLMTALLLLVFPVLDLVRTFALQQSITDVSLISILIGNFSQGHLDAFQSVMMAINNGKIYYGMQFFGAILFFIPRVWWSSKPIGSGQEIAENLGLNFTNISLSLPAELYINLWYFGVIIGACLIAIITAILDKKYTLKNMGIASMVFYIMLVPMFLLILRGDAMSAVSYTVGIYYACNFWTYIIKKIK